MLVIQILILGGQAKMVRFHVISKPKSPPIKVQKFVYGKPKHVAPAPNFTDIPQYTDIPIGVVFGTFGQIMQDTIEHYNISALSFQDFVTYIKDFGVIFPDLSITIDSYDVFQEASMTGKFKPRIGKPLIRKLTEEKEFIDIYGRLRLAMEKLQSITDLYNLFKAQDFSAQLPKVKQLIEFIKGLFVEDYYVGVKRNMKFEFLSEILDSYLAREFKIIEDERKDIENIVNDATSYNFVGKKFKVQRPALADVTENILMLNSVYKQLSKGFLDVFREFDMLIVNMPFLLYNLANLSFDKIGYYYPDQFSIKHFEQARFPALASDIVVLSSTSDEPEQVKDYFRLLQLETGFSIKVAQQLEDDLVSLLTESKKDSIIEQFVVPPYGLLQDIKSEFDRLFAQNKKSIVKQIGKELKLINDKGITAIGQEFLTYKRKLRSLFFSISDLNSYYMENASSFKRRFLYQLNSLPRQLKRDLIIKVKEARFIAQHETSLETEPQTEAETPRVKSVNILQFLASVMRDRFIVYRLIQASNKLLELQLFGEYQPAILDLFSNIERQSNDLLKKVKQVVIKDDETREKLINLVKVTLEQLVDVIDKQFQIKISVTSVIRNVRAMKVQDLFSKLHSALVDLVRRFGSYLEAQIVNTHIDQTVSVPDTLDAIKFGIPGYTKRESFMNLLVKENKYVKVR